jgi:hypothetical protein
VRCKIRCHLAFLFLTCISNAPAQGPVQPDPAELRVSSAFPGGSAKILRIDSTNNTVRITPAGDPDRGWPCWWYLRVEGINTNQPFVLEVVANESRVRGDQPGQTMNLAPAWSLPLQAALSLDGRNWEHTAPGSRQNNRISYRVPAKSRTLWLAWGPPFTLRDADELIENMTKESPYARRFELARTREGRPVSAVRISQPGTPDSERSGVWIQARQHAWECGGSWICRGLAEWLISDDPIADSLRRQAEITIVPIMDVDNVETGNGGKDARPHDQDEDWGPSPEFPEVNAAMKLISADVEKGHFSVFLDLHNPASGARDVFIYIPPTPLLDAVRLANQTAFTNIMRAELTGPIPFVGRIGPCGTTYDPAVDKTSDAWVAHTGGSRVVSLTVETAWNTPASTASGYRQIGQQLGRTIERYLRHSANR